MRKLLLTILVAAYSATASAQLKMPQASSTQTVTQEFGLGNITVKYSRPNVKRRNVFAELAPYGEVWRTGANNATVITFSDDVTLEGNSVKAGEYGLFTIPGADSWTIILNKGSKQWGAYQYMKDDDVLRFTVKASKAPRKTETFTIGFSDVLPTTAKLDLTWDDTQVSINLKTDIDARVLASIDEAMKGENKPYMQSAIYYYENDKDLKKALEWITAADDQKSPWFKYWKARIQLKAGDKAGAQASARAGIQAAQAMNIAEYVRLNNAVLAEAGK